MCEAFGKARGAHSGTLGHREDVRCRLVTTIQPRRDARVTQGRDVLAERGFDFVRLQHHRPRLPPDLPVDRGGQWAPVVEDE
jgi:hypothetical protein